MNKKKIYIFFIILIILSVSFSKQMKNKYIAILVDDNSSRYIIKTTGGDPALENDQNKLLLYQMRNYPGTSYSTLRINGENYVFGDENDGKIVHPPKIERGKVISTWKSQDIQVIQTVTFAKGVTTGHFDSAKIEYFIINKGDNPKDIGIRILLDTLLGQNDGAPFSVPNYGAVTTDKSFEGDQIPEFLYAFDDIENPTIRSQCTFRIPGYTPPDKIILSNWKRMFKEKWDVELKEGRSFKNSWLSPTDSAISIYWKERTLKPRGTMICTVQYGLYGAQIQSGDLFNVSLSGPVEVYQEEVFTITADIQNRLPDIKILNLDVDLDLPPNQVLRVTKESEKTQKFDLLEPTAIQKLSWDIEPTMDAVGEYTYSIDITGVANNQKKTFSVSREINVLKKREIEAPVLDQSALEALEDIQPVASEDTAIVLAAPEAEGITPELQAPELAPEPIPEESSAPSEPQQQRSSLIQAIQPPDDGTSVQTTAPAAQQQTIVLQQPTQTIPQYQPVPAIQLPQRRERQKVKIQFHFDGYDFSQLNEQIRVSNDNIDLSNERIQELNELIGEQKEKYEKE